MTNDDETGDNLYNLPEFVKSFDDKHTMTKIVVGSMERPYVAITYFVISHHENGTLSIHDSKGHFLCNVNAGTNILFPGANIETLKPELTNPDPFFGIEALIDQSDE